MCRLLQHYYTIGVAAVCTFTSFQPNQDSNASQIPLLFAWVLCDACLRIIGENSRSMIVDWSVTKVQMKCLLGVLFCLVVADGLITKSLIQLDLARESNPFLKGIVTQGGFPYLKMAGAAVAVFILWDMYHLRPRMASIATLVAVVVYAVIVYWNVFSYVVASV